MMLQKKKFSDSIRLSGIKYKEGLCIEVHLMILNDI